MSIVYPQADGILARIMLRWISSDFVANELQTTHVGATGTIEGVNLVTTASIRPERLRDGRSSATGMIIPRHYEYKQPGVASNISRLTRRAVKKSRSAEDNVHPASNSASDLCFISPPTDRAWTDGNPSVTTSPKSVESTTKKACVLSQSAVTNSDACVQEISVSTLAPPLDVVISQHAFDQLPSPLFSPLFSPRHSNEDVLKSMTCESQRKRPLRHRFSSSSESEEESIFEDSSNDSLLHLNQRESHAFHANICSDTYADDEIDVNFSVTPLHIPLTEKYPPNTIDDVAVGNSKIKEVTKWLQDCISFSRTSRIAVFVGNAGCGKSTLLELLAEQFDMQYVLVSSSTAEKVWNSKNFATSPSDIHYTDDVDEDDVGVCQLFERQLLSAISTAADTDFSGGKLVVVEDIPLYYAVKMPRAFHELLLRVARVVAYPLAFLYTEHYAGRGSLHRLIPPDIIKQINARMLRFNPLAPTFIQKAVRRVLEHATKQPRYAANQLRWNDNDLRRFGETSKGDLRGAINTLEFVAAEYFFAKPPSADTNTKDSNFLLSSQYEQCSTAQVVDRSQTSPRRSARRGARGGRGGRGGGGNGRKPFKRHCTDVDRIDTVSDRPTKTLDLLGAPFQRDATVHLFHTVGRLIFVRRCCSTDPLVIEKRGQKNHRLTSKHSAGTDDVEKFSHARDDFRFADKTAEPREPCMPKLLCGAGRERFPLLYNPEGVVQEAHVQAEALLLFAHENAYNKLVHEHSATATNRTSLQTLSLMAEMADSLSCAEMFVDTNLRAYGGGGNSNEKTPLHRYCESITARTLMYYNNTSSPAGNPAQLKTCDDNTNADPVPTVGRFSWAKSPVFYRYRRQKLAMLETFVEASTAKEPEAKPMSNDCTVNHFTKGSSAATLATQLLPALLHIFPNDLVPDFKKNVCLRRNQSSNLQTSTRRVLMVSTALKRCATLYHKFTLIAGQQGDELTDKCQVEVSDDDSSESPELVADEPTKSCSSSAEFEANNAASDKMDMCNEEEFFIEEFDD